MKKQLRYIITALAILLLPSVTQADEVTGKIALVDAEKHTITLTSGMTFFVAESISIVERGSGVHEGRFAALDHSRDCAIDTPHFGYGRIPFDAVSCVKVGKDPIARIIRIVLIPGRCGPPLGSAVRAKLQNDGPLSPAALLPGFS